MARTQRQYWALLILLICALAYEGGFLRDLVKVLRDPAAVPSPPFSVQIGTRTIGSGGPLWRHQILSLNGRPFTAENQLRDAVANSKPGDKLHLVLSAPSGNAIERDVPVPSEKEDFSSVSNVALEICLIVVIPAVCLILGFSVAFIRPRDPNAWLLMLLLIGFSSFAGGESWHRAFPTLSFLWESFCGSTWAIWLMLFAIRFPGRLELDRRKPWLKYLIILPSLATELFGRTLVWGWYGNIDAVLRWQPLFAKLYIVRLVLQMICVSLFFAILGMKSGTEQAPDDRRRLRILRTGASVSLAPMFLVVIYALVRDRDVFNGVPWPLVVTALCMMGLFPLTLAYVIVVERAMDLGFAIRMSVKYGLARGGLWIIRAGMLGLIVYVFSAHGGTAAKPLLLTMAGVGLVIIRRKNSDRASAWIDRKFFREAYDAEHVLAELAGEVGRYLEVKPLVEKVVTRVPAVLHVPDVVLLLTDKDSEDFRPRYSTRPGEPMSISAHGRIAAALRERNRPLEVYFDKPPDWIRELDAEELQTLDFMRTQLLLPLPGKDRLVGIMSLGPKLSEQPYSKTDLQLLQSVAMQMGMAIENSRLMTSLAESTALREVMNRELEIAREVQERLFPQKFPKVEGVDCYGYCRPARGVGGDYYDFVEQEGGKLGIAIGDVSGKGIAAALLMASLQASLRGQAMAGIHDLAALMRNVNKLVYDASQSNRYATFFYGEFDPATRFLSYVNAGHNAPVILRGDEIIRLEASGPVVGLLPGVGYTMDSCQMQPGDIFLSYTDGISEAMNEQDEEWEEERFLAAARSYMGQSAREMIEGIFEQADGFTGSAKQYDDMTLLIMKLNRHPVSLQ